MECLGKFTTFQKKNQSNSESVLIRPGYGIYFDSVDGIKVPGTNVFMVGEGKTELETLPGYRTVVCSYNEYFTDNSRQYSDTIWRKGNGSLAVSFDAIAGHNYEIVGYLYQPAPYVLREYGLFGVTIGDETPNEWYLRVRDLTDGGKEIVKKGTLDLDKKDQIAPATSNTASLK